MTELPSSEELTAEQASAAQINATSGGDLLMWTIYKSPSDYPGKFIARPYSVRRNALFRYHLAAGDIDRLRHMLPPGLVRFDRHPEDEEQIVETWF